MQIKEIVVKYGMTVNVGDYSNVRPEAEMRLTINEDDPFDVAIVEQALASVQETIREVADDELQRHGRSPIYTDDHDLFVVDRSYRHKLIAIYPKTAAIQIAAASDRSLTDGTHGSNTAPYALRKFNSLIVDHPDWKIFNCIGGDIIPLLQYLAEKDAELAAEAEQRRLEREAATAAAEAERQRRIDDNRITVPSDDDEEEEDWEDDEEEDDLDF